MIAVLAIDGGGIRGIIPAAFLVELERRTGQPICRLFDLVAGTSTGGILAALLTVPNHRNQPKYSAEQARLAYLQHGGEIFHRSPLRKAATLGGLTRPKYSPKALERILEEYLGKKRLHTTLTEILVTAYDMSSSTPWFFKTSFAREHRAPADDPLLTQVVRATTAAPTYFPPLAMEGHCLIDGGVFAANPAVCALAQARNMYPEERDFLVVSLGTGLITHNRPCSQVERWGTADWAVPISSVMLNAASATVNYQMRALAGKKKYVRFQVLLDGASSDMDDASPENMLKLDAIAQQAVIRYDAALDRVCTMLEEKNQAAPD